MSKINSQTTSAMYVTGDTHGEKSRFYNKYPYNTDLGKNDYLFIAGDAGFIFYGSSQEEKFIGRLAEEKPYTICWVDGNHENFSKLSQYPIEEWMGGKVQIIRRDKNGNPKNIHLLRGQVFTINGVKIFTFGGANSFDKAYRRPGKSWWTEEMPTDADKVEALKNLKEHNFEVDVILTHAAPESVMVTIHPDHIDEYPLNNFLEYIRETVTYKHWYFGHLHQDKEINDKMSVLFFDVRDLRTGQLINDDCKD